MDYLIVASISGTPGYVFGTMVHCHALLVQYCWRSMIVLTMLTLLLDRIPSNGISGAVSWLRMYQTSLDGNYSVLLPILRTRHTTP
jgi:hypothetical protein